jgi:16S rRNA (uracil1498-N3)-methyltransferase
MPHSRFFLDAPFQLQHELLLVGEEAHHLSRVMRKKGGETIELVNGRHQLALATILFIEKKGVGLHLFELVERAPHPFPVILCQAIPRLNRLDWIVEKGTELGMTQLWLFPGELSEKKELTPSQLNRVHTISIAALKQSGRLDLPTISLKPPLLEWEHLPCRAYFGDLSEEAPPFLSLYKKEEATLFFIGPESGFTSEEEYHLRHLAASGVKLHPHILRTDTAPLVVLSQIFSGAS